MTSFHVVVEAFDDYMTVNEIWPDGNAPENPTTEDVMAEMRKSRTAGALVDEWNLADDLSVTVDGRDPFREARLGTERYPS